MEFLLKQNIDSIFIKALKCFPKTKHRSSLKPIIDFILGVLREDVPYFKEIDKRTDLRKRIEVELNEEKWRLHMNVDKIVEEFFESKDLLQFLFNYFPNLNDDSIQRNQNLLFQDDPLFNYFHRTPTFTLD